MFLTSLSACRTLATAKAFSEGLASTTAISLDVSDTAALESAVAAHDLVISLIPYTHHAAVIKAAIKGKTNVVTTSYVSPAMRELDAAAREAGIIVLNEVGLDPGIDHLYAIKTIEEVHAKGGKVCASSLTYCDDIYGILFRSNTSSPTAVAFRLPNPLATLSDTNSLGRLAECFSLSSTRPHSFLPERPATFRATN